MTIEFLRQLPLFEGLTDEDLIQLYDMAEVVTLRAGQVLVEEGQPGDSMYIALNGTFEVSKRSGERDVVFAGCGPGDVIGEISLLERVPRTATVRAIQEANLLQISRETFRQLLIRSPSASLSVLRTMTARVRNTEAALRQNEKMAALGTLSAGLAHELNNPAAAVQRSAGQLRESLAGLQRLAAELGAMGLQPAGQEVINTARREFPLRAAAPTKLDPIARSDREDGLGEWLEEQGVASAWDLAPAIVDLGWTVDDLVQMTEPFGPLQAPVFLTWLGIGCQVYTLLDVVSHGATRIAEIVKAVKAYSYLDQAPVQLVDVHEGLDNTLVILRHKLAGGVTVVKAYAPDLPRIEAYAGELNQVWTNLIDNAVDAMGGQGQLHIRTAARDKEIIVEIGDSGPGIPPEVKGRIFDAFFTTKPIGVGTGLGLHITYNIVVHQHRGQIVVESNPGHTVFRVRLPIQIARA